MRALDSIHPTGLTRTRQRAGSFGLAFAANPWVQRLARFGMVIRGVIYFVPGIVALQVALSLRPSLMSQQSTINLIATQPAGQALLVATAIGLVGYAMWGIIRAVVDPQDRGHHIGGILRRLGYLTSAIAYIGMLAATASYLVTAIANDSSSNWTASVRSHPQGALVVAIVGVCWVLGAGLAQIVDGWTGNFMRDFDEARMGPAARHWALVMGRTGMISRGVVFTVIGALFIASSTHASTRHTVGMDDALLQILHRPFGRLMLGVAGAGLMAFGCFAAMCARWLRMNKLDRSAAAPFQSTPH